MSKNQELLSDTTDSSRVSTFEVESVYTGKSSQSTSKGGSYKQPDAFTNSKGVSLIVHPGYSQSATEPFNPQNPVDKYFAQAKNLVSFQKTSYLPPQQYGGMLDDLVSKDKDFKMQQIDNELSSNYFACYKYWILFLIPISLFVCGGIFYFLSHPLLQVPSAFVYPVAILAGWNCFQCLLEYLAIKRRSVVLAERAVILYSIFLVILFLASIGLGLVFGPKYFTGISHSLKIPAAVLTGFAGPIFFYYSTVAGAVNVYHVLRRKHTLQKSLVQNPQTPIL